MRHKHLAGNGGVVSSIRELVFGLEDSLVSTLGVVVGVAAGSDDRGVVILSGAVLVVVEALSMAAGSYLSSKSHREMLEQAIREEAQEIEEEPEREREELRAMYRQRGFTPDEVEIVVRRVTADKKLWLEEMIAKELRIGAIDLETPNKNAVVMFLSYVAGGLVPVLPFVFLSTGTATALAVCLTVIALFGVGWWKGKATGGNALRAGVEMMAVSIGAAALGAIVGSLVGSAAGIVVR